MSWVKRTAVKQRMSEGGVMEVASRAHARVAYERSGNGPPLLLAHGAEADHRMFDALIHYLRPFFTCLAFDQRGCGATEAPIDAYTADDLADDAVAVINHAGFQAAHVYGTSFGGQVAQSLAVRHPSAVMGLVLGNTWASGQVLADVSPRVASELRLLKENREANAREIAGYFFPDVFLEACPAHVERFRTAPLLGEKHRWRSRCIATAVDAAPSRIAAPTLVIAGELDRLVAARTTLELVHAIPLSMGRVLPGAGHVPCLQMSEALAGDIRFFLNASSQMPPTFLKPVLYGDNRA